MMNLSHALRTPDQQPKGPEFLPGGLSLNGPFAPSPSLMEPRKPGESRLENLNKAHLKLFGTPLPKEAESVVKKMEHDLKNAAQNYTVNSLGVITFTMNSGEQASKASIEAARATVDNYNNNVTWLGTANLQLATQRDQLAVQKQMADINAISSDTGLKSLEMGRILMGYTIRNDARQAQVFEYQQYLGTAQTEQYKVANAAAREGLDNQAKALSKQDQQIAISTQQLCNTVAIAERSYVQQDTIAKNNIQNNINLAIMGGNYTNLNVQETIANNTLTAKQNMDFQRAIQLEGSYQDARQAWNSRKLLEFTDPSKIEYYPGKDGWILASAFHKSEGRLRDKIERLSEVLSVMQSVPRPSFVTLEKKHEQERAALFKKFDADRKRLGNNNNNNTPPSNPPNNSRKKSIYFSDSDINEHWKQFTENLASGKNRKYFDKSHGAEYADKDKKTGSGKKTSAEDMKLLYRRFEELRTVLEVLPPTSTGASKQMRDAADGSLKRLHSAPNVQAFLTETNGTVNAFFGK